MQQNNKDLFEGYLKAWQGLPRAGQLASVQPLATLTDRRGHAIGLQARLDSGLELFVPEHERTSDDLEQQLMVLVTGWDEDGGELFASARRAASEVAWQRITQAAERGAVLPGRVVKTNRGGLELKVHGVSAFMPASQVDLKSPGPLENYVGQELDVLVMETGTARRRNLVVSRRKLVETLKAKREARRKVRQALRSAAESGEVVTGTVRSLKDYGALVTLGDGVEGLLHVSQIAHGHTKHPADALEVGQELALKVLSVSRKDKRDQISLSIKALTPSPWQLAAQLYKPGAKIVVRIVEKKPFGFLAEPAGDGAAAVRGLIHVSNGGRNLTLGDEITAEVLSLDAKARRMSLAAPIMAKAAR